MARLAREGNAEVRLVAFSAAEKSVPDHLDPAINRVDAIDAAVQIGIAADHVDVLDFPVRDFPDHRQAILDAMIGLRSQFSPDLIFGPCSTDRHQDHSTVHDEMMRAFGKSTVLGLELPWNSIRFDATTHVALSESDIEAKSRALGLYRSQVGRTYMNDEFVRSMAVTRGAQIGVPFAEAFEVLHWNMSL